MVLAVFVAQSALAASAHLSSCALLVSLLGRLQPSHVRIADNSGTVEVPLYDVLPDQIYPTIRTQVYAAIRASGPQNNFKETAFHVYYLKSGEVVVGPLFSSGLSMAVRYRDIMRDLLDAMKRLGADNIEHVEGFHTHPMAGSSSLQISAMDVSSSLRIHKVLLHHGILGAYSENAILTGDALHTQVGQLSRMELTPAETLAHREAIVIAVAQARADRKAQDKRRGALLSAPLLMSVNKIKATEARGWALPTDQRRQQLTNMIDATVDRDSLDRMNFSDAIALRVSRIKRIVDLHVAEEGDHVWGTGTAVSFGMGRVLGYRGDLPNQVKMESDIFMRKFLGEQVLLESPQPGALAVYVDSKLQVTGTAQVLRQENGHWIVQSKMMTSLPVVFEHRIEDVPLWFGERVYFYQVLPSHRLAVGTWRGD